MSTRCPRCGTTYAENAKYCTRDGSRLVAAGAELRMTTPPVSTDERTTGVRSAAPARGGRRLSHATMVGQILDRRYRIARKIGEGGMSFVYLAHDVATAEPYAIKILSPALSSEPSAMARLRREAGLGIRLEHPNICHIMRLGETEDGLVYIVMPYLQGELLAERTNREGQLALPLVVRFVGDIAAGLQLAHSLSIVHRDLKPENIMVVRQPDGSERAVVMDFGLAKEHRAGRELEKLTATGIVLGTPEFMSPEQLRGKPLDGRSDVYSLALMTFEMLTGKLPFMGRSPQELMISRLRSDPMPLRRMRPDLEFPAGVERVLLKGMARDPEARFQKATELAEALARAANGRDEEGSRLFGRLFGR